jgi:RND family efflux transporter MFP subunit
MKELFQIRNNKPRRNRFTHMHITRYAAGLLIFLVFSCTERNVPLEDIKPMVKAAPAMFRDLPDETDGFGSLSFLTKVDISASQEGLIKKLYFREGDTTRQGNAAVLLENPQINVAGERAQNNYSQAQATIELARSRLQDGEFQAEAQLLAIEKAETELEQAKIGWEESKRRHSNQEALYEAGGLNEEAIRTGRFSLQSDWEKILIMEKELEIRKIGCRDRDLEAAGIKVPGAAAERQEALVSLMTTGLRAELNLAAARLDAAEKELRSVLIAQDELLIRSPSSGVAGVRYFEEGERVKSGDKIFTLMDTASLYAIFPVREKDALRIEKGMKTLVRIDGTGECREGKVDLVYPQADSQSLSFLVRVLLNDGNSDLKPGMFVRATVALGPGKRVVCVPESSIVNKNGGEGLVFVLNGNQLSERKVVLGRVLGEEREIVSGLNTGELAVLQPGADLREGSYVSLAE